MIFAKTNLGRIAAFAPQSALPAPQKAQTDALAVSANDDVEQPARFLQMSLVSNNREGTMTASLATLLQPDSAPEFAASGSSHSAEYQDRLQSAKDSLIGFVLANLRQVANVVLQAVSQITHNDQLKATIIAVLSMANHASQTDPSQTRALNQALLQLADEEWEQK